METQEISIICRDGWDSFGDGDWNDAFNIALNHPQWITYWGSRPLCIVGKTPKEKGTK